MKFEKAIEQTVQQGAIRVYRLSDSTAYVYRFKDGRYQARTLLGDAESGEWELGNYLASERALPKEDGWYDVVGLPHRAKAIESEAAAQNPGFEQAALRQCYTCKEMRPEKAFERPGLGEHDRRNWECDTCYQQRLRELGRFRAVGSLRAGDSLERETLASPPPPSSEI